MTEAATQARRADRAFRSAVARPPLWARIGRIVVLAVVIGVGFNHIWWSIADWHLSDMNAYWDAGLRLRLGEPLYPPVADVTASDVYRYSPWFAWLWAPITTLPRALADVAWSAVLLAASIAAVLPFARRGAWLAVAFFLPILIGISAIGNVHALLIAALVYGVERRSGPLWIAIAASLKVFPLLFALVYLGRGEWRRAAVTGAISVLLLAPYLLYDLSNYVTSAGAGALLWNWPIVYWPVAAVAVGATLLSARGPYAWLAAATAVVLILPRSFLYDSTWIIVGVPARSHDG